MNILVLNYEFPPLGGGAAPVSKDLAISLAKQGNRVDVITMGYHSLPQYEEIEGVRIFRLKCIRNSKSSCKPWEQLSYLIAVRRFMPEHIKTNHYDICHCHFVIPTGEAARWIKKEFSIPYIITAHGSDVEGHNSKLSMRIMHFFLRPFWRRIVDRSEVVVSPSNYLLDRMRKNYSKGNYCFIPNGIDYDKFNRLNDNTLKEKRILIMGRLQSFKNVQCILKALSLIGYKETFEWKVDIVGDGPYRSELEKMSSQFGLNELVHFGGWIDNGTPEHLSFLEKASVYISASEFENCPMSVIETAVSGCRVLLSDIPAHRQLIGNEECFFEKNNPRSLAEKLLNMLSNDEFGRPDNLERFDWKRVSEEYVRRFNVRETD